MTIKTLILGGGYVGRKLAERLDAPMTLRSLEHSAGHKMLYFNLTDRSSWDNIPQSENVIWTFPALPLEQIQTFYRAKLAHATKLFVYASSSCYLSRQPDEWVDESQPLDYSRERVVGEEWLRQQGATILVLTGIYGPNRQPLDWLKKGLIKTPNKRVNLIHVDDIVALTEQLLFVERNPRGERFNLADGAALSWREIARHYDIAIQATTQMYQSKRVSNDKIRHWLGGYNFRSLIE